MWTKLREGNSSAAIISSNINDVDIISNVSEDRVSFCGSLGFPFITRSTNNLIKNEYGNKTEKRRHTLVVDPFHNSDNGSDWEAIKVLQEEVSLYHQ